MCFEGGPISWLVMVSQNMFVVEYERFKLFFTSSSVATRGAYRPNRAGSLPVAMNLQGCCIANEGC